MFLLMYISGIESGVAYYSGGRQWGWRQEAQQEAAHQWQWLQAQQSCLPYDVRFVCTFLNCVSLFQSRIRLIQKAPHIALFGCMLFVRTESELKENPLDRGYQKAAESWDSKYYTEQCCLKRAIANILLISHGLFW